MRNKQLKLHSWYIFLQCSCTAQFICDAHEFWICIKVVVRDKRTFTVSVLPHHRSDQIFNIMRSITRCDLVEWSTYLKIIVRDLEVNMCRFCRSIWCASGWNKYIVLLICSFIDATHRLNGIYIIVIFNIWNNDIF